MYKKLNATHFFYENQLQDSVDKVLIFNENDDFQTKPGFVERRLSQQKEYESKYTISMPVPVSAYELLKNNGVPDENIVRAYTEYVKHSLGLNTHTAGVDEFRVWCEESDNLVDFQ